ncbi:uncharacterized protein LOC129568819 [Sitodiplosis mosellana]|uniref:uncharacterized protein LOC129568819 n=1 Tax=Sitodiplosis mosellana TaxID=263140 RepID=UPI002443F9B3|nr:uncharacterized protein LOC129568819 [Sitodiplosis mosellana]
MLSANMKKVTNEDEDVRKNRDKCFETYNKLCCEFMDGTDRVYGGDSGAPLINFNTNDETTGNLVAIGILSYDILITKKSDKTVISYVVKFVDIFEYRNLIRGTDDVQLYNCEKRIEKENEVQQTATTTDD